MESWNEISKTVYFPLPFNDEQMKTNNMLTQNNTIIIDGPCGTGKSQTLANLICNFIIHGKDIVVTSECESSLKGLLNKVPKSIKCYCNDDFKSDANLSESEACRLYMDICKLKVELNESIIRQKEIENEIENLKKIKKSKIKYDNKKYSINYIEDWLQKNESVYGWFEDDINLKDNCPISDGEFNRLIYCLSKIDKGSYKILKYKGSIIDMLPSYNDLYKKIKNSNEIGNEETNIFIQNVKNMLMVIGFLGTHNSLEQSLSNLSSESLYKLEDDYNTIKKLKIEKAYYDEAKIYLNMLKAKCPLLTRYILNTSNYHIFEDKKISEAWKWKQLNMLFKKAKIFDLSYSYYEKKLRLEKNNELNICTKIIEKQLTYNKYINYKNNKKSNPMTVVSFKKLKKDDDIISDKDVLIIEDGNNGFYSFDVLNKFKKVIIARNSSLYGNDLTEKISSEMDISKVIFNHRYRHTSYPTIGIRVKDGARDSKKNINMAEANSIVNNIILCTQDKEYDEMSFGVISLGDNRQANLIKKKLHKKLDSETIQKRNLICGDINSFQGRERDVIFISMVVADNRRFYSARKKSDIIKYSIAMTRAKYQMWIFYSFNKDNINKECMRYKLLECCNFYN